MSDSNKLIDNGHAVVIFRNDLGSITAFSMPRNGCTLEEGMEMADEVGWLTDDFSVEKVLSRLADKASGVGDYSDPQ